jgi:hypothetical protein
VIVPAGIRVQAVEPAVSLAFLAEPPAWTRLEPQSVSGDPTPGLEARVHDPLWLLARQWQLGELEGSDAGAPVSVSVTTSSTEIASVAAGDPATSPSPRAWAEGDLLEPLVEREPAPARGPTLRQRAEGGAQLVAELRDAGVPDAMLARLLRDCRLAQPWTDRFDTTAPSLLTVLGGRVPDGERAATRIAQALAASPPTPPDWFAGFADVNALLSALRDWLAWYRDSVPAPDATSDCWIDERLEYRFSLTTRSGLTLRAPEFGGGRVDWYDFDHDATVTSPSPFTGTARTSVSLASPLRFAGMPADRYWQFEDGRVNLGALEVQPHDLGRLAFAEFALVYGNDWLCVPVDVPYGSFTSITSLEVADTFGERATVGPADDTARSGRFRLFELSETTGEETLAGLLVPPVAPAVLAGDALEEVLYLRDETANMVWGVESVVEGPSGEPRSRGDEPRPAPFAPGTDPGADMDYLLETQVPTEWIPFVPVATGYATIALRKGAMVVDGAPVQPVGVLLRPGQPLVLADEEVPREGVRVRRTRALARRVDGTYVRWTTRRVFVGRGEGSSGLAFDSAIRRRPTGGGS